MAEMSGRVCLVTGASDGIGLETARGLARLGAEVLMHGRDAAKLEAAMKNVSGTVPCARLSPAIADFASLGEVRRMAGEILSRPGPLHVVASNAGVLSLSAQTTKDGFELMFGVNHLAPFLLVNLLLEKIEASAPARIVVVASRAHFGSRIDLRRLDPKPGLGNLSDYGRSKFANVLFAKELARRLEGTGVTANALHPGLVMTNMVKNRRPPVSLVVPLLKPFLITPQEGAKTSIYLASSPEVAGITGKYFDKCRAAAPDPATADEDLAKRLWEKSAEMVRL